MIISILICQGAGLAGSLFTMPAISSGWYAGLIKPRFTPPSWVFAPAWTTLFLLMGIALYLVWIKEGEKKKKALIIFAVQLVLNALWSILFFGLKSPLLGMIDIIFLWAAILGTIIAFGKISKKAGWLLAPYLGWVSFASLLNFYILKLN